MVDSNMINPNDKHLLRPGIEYLRMITDYVAKEFTCEYFDLENYRKEVLSYTDERKMPFSSDWQVMAQRNEREVAFHYCQRPKREAVAAPEPESETEKGFWAMLKSRLSLKY